MQVIVLGSGSRGNCLLIKNAEQQLFMIDCGLGYRDLLNRCQAQDISLKNLKAIFLTHEHNDHVKSALVVATNCDCICYLSRGTYISLGQKVLNTRYEKLFQQFNYKLIADGDIIAVNDFTVEAVTVPHDAREPIQFVIRDGDNTFGHLTDIGFISQHVATKYNNCRHLYLEFNHDRESLESGPYPPSLKQRVGGDYGHLSNRQSLDFIESLQKNTVVQTLLVAHISEKNNSITAIKSLLESSIHTIKTIVFCEQNQSTKWITI